MDIPTKERDPYVLGKGDLLSLLDEPIALFLGDGKRSADTLARRGETSLTL